MNILHNIFLSIFLLVLSLIDVRVFKIHNISIGILLCYALIFYPHPNWVLMFSVLFFLTIMNIVLSKIFHKECLGYGDVKLMAGLCLFLELKDVPNFFLISSSLSTVYIFFVKKNKIPFCPFISIGFLVTLLLL